MGGAIGSVSARRQTWPERWVILNHRSLQMGLGSLHRMPRGIGVILVDQPDRKTLQRLARAARQSRLTLAMESTGTAARVHNMRELTAALGQRVPLILLSPIYRTRSHPDWQPLPRMRAATLARLAKRKAIALGGMNARRFRSVQPLGFTGWAGIDAWLKPPQ